MTDFHDLELRDATFHDIDVRGGRFDHSYVEGVRLRGVEFVDVEIEGEVYNVRVNGVDIGPLIEAQLDSRDPERGLMRPHDAAGHRQAWEIVERRWDETVARARALDPALLHESVEGEWSFVETLRHLCFATDAWLGRAILGDPAPWHPLDLPWDQMADTPGIPRDRDVRPSLDEVLELRRDRMGGVAAYLDQLTDDELGTETTPVEAPGWPRARAYPVAEVLHTILNEEWMHRQYAERDLTLLGSR
ncbi:MAG: DinB family protein [Nocardioides sp.]